MTWRLTDRQKMIQAWGWLAFARGLFYTPALTPSSDIPAPVRLLLSDRIFWSVSVVWCLVGCLAAFAMYSHRAEKWWWPTFLALLMSWSGMFIAAWWLGYAPSGWATGLFYLAIARGVWASRGDDEPTEAGEDGGTK